MNTNPRIFFLGDGRVTTGQPQGSAVSKAMTMMGGFQGDRKGRPYYTRIAHVLSHNDVEKERRLYTHRPCPVA